MGVNRRRWYTSKTANQLTDQLEDDSATDPNLKIWFGHTLDRTARGRWTQYA